MFLQVQMVLEWTSGMGVDLMAGVPGPHGLTALHLAAVMVGGASLAALLTGLSSQRICQLSHTVFAHCTVPVFVAPKSTPRAPCLAGVDRLWMSSDDVVVIVQACALMAPLHGRQLAPVAPPLLTSHSRLATKQPTSMSCSS